MGKGRYIWKGNEIRERFTWEGLISISNVLAFKLSGEYLSVIFASLYITNISLHYGKNS